MHTSGPCTIYAPDSPGRTYGINGGDGTAVVFFGETSMDGINELADAQLIAAAPDLLAFLKRLAAAGEWSRPVLEFNTLLHDGEDLEREMLTLIAKAEGDAA